MNQISTPPPVVAKKHTSWVLFVPVVLGVVLGIGILVHQMGWLATPPTLPWQTASMPAITAPELQADLAVAEMITVEEGGVIRVVDAYGVAAIVKIPPGAVSEDIEITVTPFAPGGTQLHYGVEISPNITFTKPVSLSFNWFLAETLGHENRYTNRPVVVAYESESLMLVPVDRALVAANYVPTSISRAGTYGVTDVAAVVVSGAKTAVAEAPDTLTVLHAGLTLLRQNELTRTERAAVSEAMTAVLESEEPDVRTLFAALLFDEAVKETAFIPTVLAYGLHDGYLQFRCQLPESTYEDVRNAMIAAQKLGYSDVFETCKKAAEDRLLKRANEIDGDPRRPLIDAVEVLQQMQLLGLDDAGSRGAAVAKRLEQDIIATLEDYSTARQLSDIEVTDGRVRPNTPSSDPLIKGNSKLAEEMFGVSVMPLIGIDSFDEAGLKRFGARMEQQMDGLIMITDAMCDVSMLLGQEVLGYVDPQVQKHCDKIKSGVASDAVDVLRQDVDEMAEGVGATQAGQTPNDNWDDYTPSEEAVERLENW